VRNPGLFVALLLCTGCSAATAYKPARTAAGELTLSYDDGFRVTTPSRPVADGPRYSGLADFVGCVPKAREHAEGAQSWGRTSTVLSGLTIGFAAVGMGGLAGLAFTDEKPGTAAAFLVGGLLVETAAIVLGATSIGARSRAHGNAFDAVNYYNDALGFSGGSCGAPRTE
jgi:hypothetical protein